MADYILNWSNDTIKLPLTVYSTTVDTTATSITLFGKGAANYGEGLQENLIRMLENFASNIAPPAPTAGQLWYDTSIGQLKVYDGTSFVLQGVTTAQPASPTAGQLWYDTTAQALKVYDATTVSWKDLATAASVTVVSNDLAAHSGDYTKHLTPTQNAWLDAISTNVSATEINYLDGVTSSIQTQINNINNTLNGVNGTIPLVNPVIAPKDGDIRTSGTTAAPVIEIYALGGWRKVFPAQYA